MLPTDAKARKAIPISSGCLKYFPDALTAVAQLSYIANEQHNPGEPLHWAKEKSTDEADALARHQVQHVKGEMYDSDGLLHATKVAWRGLAQLQRLLESGVAPLAPLARLTPTAMQEMHDESGFPWGSATPLKAGSVNLNICSYCGADLQQGMHSAYCLANSARAFPTSRRRDDL